METFYIRGYRIAARSYGQALAAAEQLDRYAALYNWPGERDHGVA